jgi:hypothetical protein
VGITKSLIVLLVAGLSVSAADLSGVKSVYLMPMSGGLDQYLAVGLAKVGVIHVVTDPQRADAIFTDRIGANFEQSLQNMYAEKKRTDDFIQPVAAPGSRGKGSLFLVDRQSRVVLWSIYAKAKSRDTDAMNRLAMKITDQLDKDQAVKKLNPSPHRDAVTTK